MLLFNLRYFFNQSWKCHLKTSYVIVQREQTLMLLFRNLRFKNILCYCSTASANTFATCPAYLKTSYVIVQLFQFRYLRETILHLKTSYVIVQLIVSPNHLIFQIHLKTSYVIVQLVSAINVPTLSFNLKTSYVIVQLCFFIHSQFKDGI